jgi:hypothetical protein
MPVPSSAFRGSNRAQMMSNTNTTQQQGGGNKKAGFAYQVGRDSWTSIYMNGSAPVVSKRGCASLKCLQFTVNPNVHISRPIGSTYRPNTYFHITGTR